ncbi:8296_t:CDS:2 [Diversispora eburnea]|uniref:8296_t:CDS:1 n=1 Tax=Diversispora eburnea TaxID=1213867 RepID=A0A9N9ASK4_9GLOM|nr:8296_t:CDS:2 [Diversispora eburnea]
MSGSHITPGKLVVTGSIESKLHYELKVMIQLNNNPFVVHIVTASAAITSGYQLAFGGKTKCPGLSYLDLDQPGKAQKLLGFTFRPFIIEVENTTVLLVVLAKLQQT